MEEPMSRLTHDLIAEILSRVPYKSLCICKCVCPAWRDLIADPANRKKIVQSLAGFFYHITDETTADSAESRGFPGVDYADLSAFPWASVPRTHPRLPLPPDSTDCFFTLADSCDGLFLTRFRTGTPELQFRYIVSNPATSEYTLLPHSGYAGNCFGSYLGFDSGVSTEEFHVFEFVKEWPDHPGVPPVVTGVNIYSSETGAWVAMEPKWDIEVSLCGGQLGVFRNGCLHLLIHNDGLAIVDAQGLKWRTIPVPNFIDPSFSGFIGKSAGQLFYIDSDDREEGYGSALFSTISVYVLSSGIYNWGVSHLDDECTHWSLLHKLSDVIPKKKFCLGQDLKVVGVHPHANMIFLADLNNNELLAYDLDHHESTAVHHIERNYLAYEQYFPYVPLLSSLPLDGRIRLATPS